MSLRRPRPKGVRKTLGGWHYKCRECGGRDDGLRRCRSYSGERQEIYSTELSGADNCWIPGDCGLTACLLSTSTLDRRSAGHGSWTVVFWPHKHLRHGDDIGPHAVERMQRWFLPYIVTRELKGRSSLAPIVFRHV